MTWRVKEKCCDCPFASSGAGLHLRKSLSRRRWREILASLRQDRSFMCHKTTDETGNGKNLICAGALAWQEKHNGQPSQLARIMERIAYFRGQRSQ